MVDRIASDHPSINTVRARVSRRAGRRRLISIPDDADAVLPDHGIIEVLIDGRRRFGRCQTVDSRRTIIGIYQTSAAAAGETAGADSLDAWLTENDRPVGSSVLIDVLEPAVRIGLRQPGDRAVYGVLRERDSSLDDIAKEFFGGSNRSD